MMTHCIKVGSHTAVQRLLAFGASPNLVNVKVSKVLYLILIFMFMFGGVLLYTVVDIFHI